MCDIIETHTDPISFAEAASLVSASNELPLPLRAGQSHLTIRTRVKALVTRSREDAEGNNPSQIRAIRPNGARHLGPIPPKLGALRVLRVSACQKTFLGRTIHRSNWGQMRNNSSLKGYSEAPGQHA